MILFVSEALEKVILLNTNHNFNLSVFLYLLFSMNMTAYQVLRFCFVLQFECVQFLTDLDCTLSVELLFRIIRMYAFSHGFNILY